MSLQILSVNHTLFFDSLVEPPMANKGPNCVRYLTQDPLPILPQDIRLRLPGWQPLKCYGAEIAYGDASC